MFGSICCPRNLLLVWDVTSEPRWCLPAALGVWKEGRHLVTNLIPTPTPSLWAGMGHCSGWAQERLSLPQFSSLGFPQSWPDGEGTPQPGFPKSPTKHV